MTDPDGNRKSTVNGQVTFDNARAGSYCLAEGGSHIVSPSTKCYSLSDGGTKLLGAIENTPEALTIWSAGLARLVDVTSKKFAARKGDWSQ